MRRLALRPWIRFNDAGDGGGGTGKATEEDPGFPANTPVVQMTTEQQVAYWKFHARKHEGRANAAADYDAIKAERDRLRDSTQTAEEKALADAEARGRTASDELWQPRVARAALTAGLVGRGMKTEDVEEELSLVDAKAFLTDKGEVDTDKVSKFLDRRAPAQAGSGSGGSTTFGLGQQQQIQTAGADAGKAEAERRFGSKQ